MYRINKLKEMKQVFNFPPGKGKWQNLIASIAFLKNPIRTISLNMMKYSGTYSVHLLGTGKLIITESPDFIQYVLRDNHSNYQKSVLSTKTAARLFGRGLLFSNGGYWLKQRRMIQPGFHHSKIQALNEIVAKTAKEYIAGIPTGSSVDIYPLMHELSFSVLIHSLFDINLSAETISELSRGFTDLQDFLMKDINQPFRKILYPLNKTNKVILAKSNGIRKIIGDIISKRRADQGTHHDLLDMLLATRYEDTGEGMEEEQIVDEILVLLFAGHETTANTISWILYLLAGHPECAHNLKKSINKTDIYSSMKNEYMQAVISEGMRLYPAAWMTERVALKDDSFNGFSYPKGTIVIPFFYGLHRNEKYWNNESAFDPERFIFSDPSASKKVKNYFPFGAGPRMCIGNYFAMSEMAIILHIFFSKFEISPSGKEPGMWPLITLRPSNLFLTITPATCQEV